MYRQQVNQLQIVADAGFFTLTHEGNTTTPLGHNATKEEIQAALNVLPSIIDGNDVTLLDVTVQDGGVPGVFNFVLAPAGELTLAADNLSGAGLIQFDTPADTITLQNIQNIQGTPGNDILYGSTETNVFTFTESSGQDLVYGIANDNSEQDVLDFSGFSVTKSEFPGGVIVTWGRTMPTR